MRIASLPVNEDLRLQDLYNYDVLDTETEKEFDDLLQVVAEIYQCPMAAITFIDKDYQFCKSQLGLGGDRKTSRDFAFCSHTILSDEVMLVRDATKDVRFNDNPYVTGAPQIRFYAGAPIVSQAGFRLGAVCVIDREPRALGVQETRLLSIISQQVAKLLELRLKNRLLKKRAEDQMRIEKRLLYKLLMDHESQSLQISTTLHENIAQGLAATRFYLELAGGESLAKEELVQKSRQNVELLLEQVRQLSYAITPTTLREFCLEDLLQNLVSSFTSSTAIDITLTYEGTRQLPADMAMDLYRIVEEQLKNIRQHAKATAVTIHLQIYKCIYLMVKDNGIGMELTSFQKGVGLQTILSRVESHQGYLDISGQPGRGCELKVTIPLLTEAMIIA